MWPEGEDCSIFFCVGCQINCTTNSTEQPLQSIGNNTSEISLVWVTVIGKPLAKPGLLQISKETH